MRNTEHNSLLSRISPKGCLFYFSSHLLSFVLPMNTAQNIFSANLSYLSVIIHYKRFSLPCHRIFIHFLTKKGLPGWKALCCLTRSSACFYISDRLRLPDPSRQSSAVWELPCYSPAVLPGCENESVKILPSSWTLLQMRWKRSKTGLIFVHPDNIPPLRTRHNRLPLILRSDSFHSDKVLFRLPPHGSMP